MNINRWFLLVLSVLFLCWLVRRNRINKREHLEKVKAITVWCELLAKWLNTLNVIKVENCDGIVNATRAYRHIMHVGGTYFHTQPKQVQYLLGASQSFFSNWNESYVRDWKDTSDTVIWLGPDGNSLSFLRGFSKHLTDEYALSSGETIRINMDVLLQWFNWPDVLGRLEAALDEASAALNELHHK
jgi:hypothetical protein